MSKRLIYEEDAIDVAFDAFPDDEYFREQFVKGIEALPSAQPERCEDCVNFSKTRLLIPQPEKRTEERTETHGVCLDAWKADFKGFVDSLDMPRDDYKGIMEYIDEVPSIQPEQRWIPVTEALPEEHESIWAKAKGTDRWSVAMWEKQSDEVIVTELFEDGTTRTDTACTHDGEWYMKAKIVKRNIIAWMPLPEPYKEEQ